MKTIGLIVTSKLKQASRTPLKNAEAKKSRKTTSVKKAVDNVTDSR